MAMDDQRKLHIVMLPWLAMGHIIPFFELSRRLAKKGHHISFVSTLRNLQRLPSTPPNINLVQLPLPHVDGLPENAESTIDLPPDKVHYLKKAFDGLKEPFLDLIQELVPDWIIYDFAPYWLPPLAKKFNIPCAFFSLFNAASLSFFGPTSVLKGVSNQDVSFAPNEDYTIVPKWIDFPSNVVSLRLYEATRILNTMKENVAEVEDGYRYGVAVESSDVVFIRSCVKFESFWLNLASEILEKPVIPIGLLPPTAQEGGNNTEIDYWLEKQETGSVLYVALGTEATLTQEEINGLAIGLELSNLPFFWVLRKPTSSVENDSYLLPTGFEERVRGRGIICRSWAPQLKILSHKSTGGFLTHCGWNSIIESLSFGRALVLLPLLADQGINARVLHAEKIGLEIPRDKISGLFTSDSVAESLRTVMVDEKGEIFRRRAGEMKKMFGDLVLHDEYVDNLVSYLEDHKHYTRDLLV